VSRQLVEVFVAAAPAPLRQLLAAVPQLGGQLAAVVDAGRQAWPDLPLAPERLMAFIAYHVDEASSVADVVDGLDGLRPADLHLACACAEGVPEAIATFDRQYIKEVDIALAKMRISGPRLADVRQLVRQRLFVPTPASGSKPASPGKIVEYAGRGDLRRWVRAVAVRTCLNELRKGKHEVLADDDQLIAQHAIPGDDPEIEYMKRTYAGEFRAAFAEALAGMPGARADPAALPPRRRPQHRRDRRDLSRAPGHRVPMAREGPEQLVAATLERLRGRLRSAPRSSTACCA
jgi:RNA polymerase sigma-70 factor